MERERDRRPKRERRFTPVQRVGLILLGLLMIAAGAALLVRGNSGTAARLGRVAGIMILVGVVLAVLGGVGRT
ncbi:MAG: hypothetical protein PVSMB7_26830 [Chloroflexota bacterium]